LIGNGAWATFLVGIKMAQRHIIMRCAVELSDEAAIN
jgi:hypothetical protein